MSTINLTTGAPVEIVPAPEAGSVGMRIVPTGRIAIGNGPNVDQGNGTVVEAGESLSRETGFATYAVALGADCTVSVETDHDRLSALFPPA